MIRAALARLTLLARHPQFYAGLLFYAVLGLLCVVMVNPHILWDRL